MNVMKYAMASVAAIFLMSVGLVSASETVPELTFHPVRHASFIIRSGGLAIFVDPVGSPADYDAFPKADIILITHSHKDHLSREVIDAVRKPETVIITNRDSAAGLSGARVLANGDRTEAGPLAVEAIPAYNLSSDRLQFHPGGRDNGYILTLSGQRIYISGDTEDIPEMRNLKGIDFAFVCMNLPYTMTEDQAASCVLAFRPKVVFPYHYRGKAGMSDLERFKSLVEKDGSVEVRLLTWY